MANKPRIPLYMTQRLMPESRSLRKNMWRYILMGALVLVLTLAGAAIGNSAVPLPPQSTFSAMPTAAAPVSGQEIINYQDQVRAQYLCRGGSQPAFCQVIPSTGK